MTTQIIETSNINGIIITLSLIYSIEHHTSYYTVYTSFSYPDGILNKYQTFNGACAEYKRRILEINRHMNKIESDKYSIYGNQNNE